MSFAFSFGGEDIEGEQQEKAESHCLGAGPALRPTERPPIPFAGAFPVAGNPQLPTVHHDLDEMLSALPSKIAFGMLRVDDGASLPRRELWDVKVQVMAEQDVDAELDPGLGAHDVKTGVYEGGFKSWESSVDLVGELRRIDAPSTCLSVNRSLRVLELGCGTALPSLSIFQAIAEAPSTRGKVPFFITVADYNPTVLQLVTLPNFILVWALAVRSEDRFIDQAFDGEEELELSSALLDSFRKYLSLNRICLSFVSGGWSEQFVETLYSSDSMLRGDANDLTLILGAETIYSPFALASFTETLLSILRKELVRHEGGESLAVIAAKRHYFGVGGSLDDFVNTARERGCSVEWLREEGQGVRRGVVTCKLENLKDERVEP